MIKNQRLFLAWLLLNGCLEICLATHFRGGSISFRPLRWTDTLEIQGHFLIHFSWRRDYGSVTFCDQDTIDSQTPFGPILDITCEIGCEMSSQVIGNTSIICTSFSGPDDWSFGQNSFEYILKPDNYYEVSFIGGYWVELVLQGHMSNWEIRTKFNTFPRSHANPGELNTSPSTLVPPVILLRSGFVHRINIPSIDLNYDVVRCRWARSDANECSDICMELPFAKLLPNCTVIFDANNAQTGWYAVALVLEDFVTSSSTFPLSSVPIQFLASVKKQDSTCKSRPSIIGDRPVDSCFAAEIGKSLSERIVAQVNCLDETIEEIQILGPVGSIATPISRELSSTWYSSINWTPTSDQYGPNLICSIARDSSELISELSCFTVLVGISAPQIIRDSARPSGLISSRAGEDLTFYVNFTKPVNRPFQRRNINKIANTAFIRIISRRSNNEVFHIDSNEAQITNNNQTLSFTLPADASSLEVGETYFISFDFGVVIGLEYCQPISDEIRASDFWTFTIDDYQEETTIEVEIQPDSTSYVPIEATYIVGIVLAAFFLFTLFICLMVMCSSLIILFLCCLRSSSSPSASDK